MTINIDELDHCPQFRDTIARYCFDEWKDIHYGDFNMHCADDFFKSNNYITVVVAHSNKNKYLGSVCLIDNDMPSIVHDYTPWLSCLFVDEKYRNQGIGSMLIKRLMNQKEKMYLWTTDDLVKFYEKLGWKVIQSNINYFGKTTTIMAIGL